jgi:hypothetical protein
VLVGGLVASGLRGAAAALGREATPPWDTRQELVDRGVRIETIASEPLIADWRAAIAACGLKPSTYKSSPEQLARRFLKRGPLHTGLVLVDVYCDVATRHLAPLGGYDAGRLPGGDVRLRLADPSADEFHPLGGRDGEMPLGPDVAVYAVGSTRGCSWGRLSPPGSTTRCGGHWPTWPGGCRGRAPRWARPPTPTRRRCG